MQNGYSEKTTSIHRTWNSGSSTKNVTFFSKKCQCFSKDLSEKQKDLVHVEHLRIGIVSTAARWRPNHSPINSRMVLKIKRDFLQLMTTHMRVWVVRDKWPMG